MAFKSSGVAHLYPQELLGILWADFVTFRLVLLLLVTV